MEHANQTTHQHTSQAPPASAIVNLPLTDLHPFPNQPFRVRDDDSMKEIAESVKQFGVIVPAIVRPLHGGYEIISGHRRKYACELAGLKTIPAIVRDLDRDAATILLVDSNLQREHILPSEKAFAYKMKLEAIRRQQGTRTDLTSATPLQKLNVKSTRELLAEQAGESHEQIRKYIRLTHLIPELRDLVDNAALKDAAKQKMALRPAVELSYLKPQEQALMVETIESEQSTPSLSQAQRLRRMSEAGTLNEDTMLDVMSEQKKPETWNLSLPVSRVAQFCPRSYTPRQMENLIFKLLESWQRQRQRQQSR